MSVICTFCIKGETTMINYVFDVPPRVGEYIRVEQPKISAIQNFHVINAVHDVQADNTARYLVVVEPYTPAAPSLLSTVPKASTAGYPTIGNTHASSSA